MAVEAMSRALASDLSTVVAQAFEPEPVKLQPIGAVANSTGPLKATSAAVRDGAIPPPNSPPRAVHRTRLAPQGGPL